MGGGRGLWTHLDVAQHLCAEALDLGRDTQTHRHRDSVGGVRREGASSGQSKSSHLPTHLALVLCGCIACLARILPGPSLAILQVCRPERIALEWREMESETETVRNEGTAHPIPVRTLLGLAPLRAELLIALALLPLDSDDLVVCRLQAVAATGAVEAIAETSVALCTPKRSAATPPSNLCFLVGEDLICFYDPAELVGCSRQAEGRAGGRERTWATASAACAARQHCAHTAAGRGPTAARVVGILVGMVLERKLAVGLFDLHTRRRAQRRAGR